MENTKKVTDKNFAEIPTTSGVYFFYNKKDLLYIGKAINLRDRVKSHFQQPSYRDNLFISQIDGIEYRETNSEIEALVLESQLINKNQPKFNVIWKDDKRYFYVAVGKNNFDLPYLYITHQKTEPNTKFIGPFVDGNALRKVLKVLRRPFPYYSNKNHPLKKCPYCHLDLCPGYNTNKIAYQKSIKKLILILEGQRSKVVREIKQEMESSAKTENFETAGKLRDQFLALEKILDHTHVLEGNQINQMPDAFPVLQKIINLPTPISKIECYDISNIQGKHAVGSMVVFVNGNPDKKQYKKFKIKIEEEPNDIAMLQEVISRRLSHPEWIYPEVMLIDGGKAQLNIAIAEKEKNLATKQITVISIAKGRKELFIENKESPIPLKNLPQEVYNVIVRLDDEAHRFAITYHKKIRKRNLLGE